MPGLVLQEQILHFPKFAQNLFVLKICNMRSIQSEIYYRKLLFFARLILKEHKNLISELFKCRVKSYFVDTSCSIGFVKEVVQLLNKYDLSHHFIDGYHTEFFFALQLMETNPREVHSEERKCILDRICYLTRICIQKCISICGSNI